MRQKRAFATSWLAALLVGAFLAAPPAFGIATWNAASSTFLAGCTQFFPSSFTLSGPARQVAVVTFDQQLDDRCGTSGSVYEQKPMVVTMGSPNSNLEQRKSRYVGYELIGAASDATGIYILYVPSRGADSGYLMLGKISWSFSEAAPRIIHKFGLKVDAVDSASISAHAGKYLVAYDVPTKSAYSGIRLSGNVGHQFHDRQIGLVRGTCWTNVAVAVSSSSKFAVDYADCKNHTLVVDQSAERNWRRSQIKNVRSNGSMQLIYGKPGLMAVWPTASKNQTDLALVSDSSHRSVVPLDGAVTIASAGDSLYAFGTRYSPVNKCFAASLNRLGDKWKYVRLPFGSPCVPGGLTAVSATEVVGATGSFSQPAQIELWTTENPR